MSEDRSDIHAYPAYISEIFPSFSSTVLSRHQDADMVAFPCITRSSFAIVVHRQPHLTLSMQGIHSIRDLPRCSAETLNIRPSLLNQGTRGDNSDCIKSDLSLYHFAGSYLPVGETRISTCQA